MDLSFSEQLLEGSFFNFLWANKKIKSCIKKLFIIFLKFFLGVKIGYHSRFNPECNIERGFIDSLYIALGLYPVKTIET